jgi:ribose transport system permease protein
MMTESLIKRSNIPDRESSNSWARYAPKSPVWYTTIALFLISWVLAPGSVSKDGIDSLLPFTGVLAIAAVGQTLVVMLRGIDLSLPGTVTLAALVSSQYAADHGGNVALALLVVAVIAVVIGTVNGIVVAVFEVTPLVATLAMNVVILGFAIRYTGGTPTRAPESVSDFALDKTLGISNTVLMALLLVLIATGATSRTTWGRWLGAVGASEATSRAAGVRVVPVKISGYIAAALCYSGAGVLLGGYVSTPGIDVGNSLLLPAIAAVVVGGTSLIGGKGNVVGTAVGALFLSQLTALVLSLGAPSSIQYIIQAVVIGVAVGVQSPGLQGYVQRLRMSRESSARAAAT